MGYNKWNSNENRIHSLPIRHRNAQSERILG